MQAVLVKNANRMMTVASLLEDGIDLSFADGSKGLIPYGDVPEIKECAAVSSLELPNPYEMVLGTAHGEQVEIPWDFARHYCDVSYRPTIEAIDMRGRQTVGERIRQLMESAGLTQEALARAENIGRVTLVRLEKGEQTPRFKTIDAIAKALGIRVPELLVEPEWLLQWLPPRMEVGLLQTYVRSASWTNVGGRDVSCRLGPDQSVKPGHYLMTKAWVAGRIRASRRL